MASVVLAAIASSLSDFHPCFTYPAQAVGVILYDWVRKAGSEVTDSLTRWLKRRFNRVLKSARQRLHASQASILPTSISTTVIGDEDEDVLEVIIDTAI